MYQNSYFIQNLVRSRNFLHVCYNKEGCKLSMMARICDLSSRLDLNLCFDLLSIGIRDTNLYSRPVGLFVPSWQWRQGIAI